MQGFNEIFWHDSEIESVVEIPIKDVLIFNVQYPIDWKNNIFEPRSIVFYGCFSYEVVEIPFEGNPTILDGILLSEVGSPFQQDGFFKVHIKTNAGDRFITSEKVELCDQHVGI
ncbi:hypothetical protein L4C36_09805 [Photobacterium japonica]|uniref:hypothetical protein n=1 Tax=Photobacterium japonica TaxID=2910235 RepID=UPI003D13F1BC